VAVSTATDDQVFPTITSDGSAGAIITWYDKRNGPSPDIYAQRINGSGISQWTASGTALCTATGTQDKPVLVSDGSGGAIMVWNDARNGNPDVYAQRVSTSGAALWGGDGVPVVNAAEQQAFPTLIPIAGGGAIFTWQDFRNDIKGDVYAQRLQGSGTVPTGVGGTTPALSMAVGDNYPNPFSTRTAVTLTLGREAAVNVEVFDAAGRRVRAIDVGHRSAGAHALYFDGLDDRAGPLPSGVYFYRVHAGSESVTKKMVIAR
jgi:hypothetical protein